jgi:hypothetical protein
MSRLILVGDVHGTLTELKLLMEKLAFKPHDDTCVIVGDLVDRGQDSPGVVRYCIQKGIDAIQGNHDTKLLRRANHMHKMETTPGYRNPMRPSDDQERTIRAMTRSELGWLAARPYYRAFPELNLIAVHAGVLPGIPVERQSKEVLTMVRYIDNTSHRKMIPFLMPGFRQPPDSVSWTDVYDRPQRIVFGHHVHSMTEPLIATREGFGTCFGIDTGCVFGGRLTAAVFHHARPENESPEIVQVDALEEYWTRENAE